MIKNYLKITIRHLSRQLGYTTLNILGLTVGIVSCLLIVLYLFTETNYDKQHTKADRIFRISSDFTEPDNSFRWAVTQFPLGRGLKDEVPEVEQYTRLMQNGRTTFEKDDDSFFEVEVYLADSTIFEIFDYDFVYGDPETALIEPNTICLNRTIASKLFGDNDPIGEFIKADDNTVKVTGVYEDIPTTNHIRPSALISASTEDWTRNQNWGGFNIFTYILIREGVEPSVLEQRLAEINKKYVAVIFDQFDVTLKYELINIRDIHLYSDFQGEPEPLGNIKYIYIFGAIGVFLILIASINYMNLSTARSMKRSLEVGIRKVMGAQRNMLIGQFITESILLTVVAFIISLILMIALVPFLNDMLQTRMELANLGEPAVLLTIGIILLFTGVLSGSYPAFYLSAFKPVAVLKGKGGRSGNKAFRSVLVGIQFAISIFMLIGTMVIYQQMQFLQEKDLGFDKEKVMRVHLNSRDAREKWPVLRDRILQSPHVTDAGTSSTSPGRGFGKNIMSVETNTGGMEEYGIDSYAIDFDYVDVLGMKIVEGRNISEEYSADTVSSVLVNESMVKRMSWENPIGKKFQFDGDSTVFHRVVGVIKDFHQRSLYAPIEALLFIPSENNSNALIKLNGDMQASIRGVEESWMEVFPNMPFEYSFLDEDFMDQYEVDQLRGQLFLGFSIMMIFIACLGLLGLASFIAEQRTKEISIRKVLGANLFGLVSLIIKDFMILVILGAIPAFGLAYYFMGEWLTTFEYHVELSAMVFILVLVVISLITILTTGYHALRAANSNPADNLKYE
ncbi:MAG: ABC transporter permease [Cyclobacteriaceae bacterium]